MLLRSKDDSLSSVPHNRNYIVNINDGQFKMNSNVTPISKSKPPAVHRAVSSALPKKAVPADRQQTAEFIGEAAAELTSLARNADLKFLVYLLEMVFQEAYQISTIESGSIRDAKLSETE